MIQINLSKSPDYAAAEAKRSELRQARNALREEVQGLEKQLAELGDDGDDLTVRRTADRLLNGGIGDDEAIGGLRERIRDRKQRLAGHELALGDQKAKLADLRADLAAQLQQDLLPEYRLLVREVALAVQRVARANAKINAVHEQLAAVGVTRSHLLAYAGFHSVGVPGDISSSFEVWMKYLRDRKLLVDADGELLGDDEPLVEGPDE